MDLHHGPVTALPTACLQIPLIPMSDHPQTCGLLHHIAADAGQLAADLHSRGPADLPPEVRDSLAILLDKLSALPGCSEELCAVACEAAFLVAAMMDPAEGMGPQVPRVTAGLLGRLQAAGLMDPYFVGDGQFGLWGEPAAVCG